MDSEFITLGDLHQLSKADEISLRFPVTGRCFYISSEPYLHLQESETNSIPSGANLSMLAGFIA